MQKILSALFLLLLIFSGSSAMAEEPTKERFEGLLNKLLAPGPLALGHDNLEHKDCLKCHEPGGGVPSSKCLDCHKPINAHVLKKQHFHGLMNNKPCIECHKEHQGRNANIMPLDQETFDHSKTGYVLDGAHARAECTSCHTEKRSDKLSRKNETQFFGKQGGNCISCHAKDDIHYFETPKFKGKDCASCHVTEAWKDVEKFDHSRETGYALVGAHAEKSCKTCHVSEGPKNIKYKWPNLGTQKCLACHKEQHQGNFSPKFSGPQCLTCHNQKDWKQNNFKHDLTGFPLSGAHARQNCVDCHKSNNVGKATKDFNFKGLQKACASCHADYHGFGNEVLDKLKAPAKNCQTCHTDQAWKVPLNFQHNSDTRFPISGKHVQNSCFDCHKPKGGTTLQNTPNTLRTYFFKGLPKKTCESCHTSPHPQSFHKRFKNVPCQSCHTPDGWNIRGGQGSAATGAGFHDKTRFPLTGSHSKLTCKSCHNTTGVETYKFPSFDKKFCVDCHTTPHKTQFSTGLQEKSCATCHTTVKFDQRLPFDHDSTGFKLEGQHQGVKSCWSCHLPTKQNIPLIKVRKPAHNFKFSREKDPNLCANCHVTVHGKQFQPEFVQKSCATCHTPNGFELSKLLDFNHNQTDFKITGAHQKFAKNCVQCHKPTRDIVLPTKPPKVGKRFIFPGEKRGYCENCHANEHKNMFDPKFSSQPCVACHTTTAFSQRKAFDHKKTDFELKGKHQKVKCAECHTPTRERFKGGDQGPKGKYEFPEMKKKDCAACHTDPHKGGNGPKCSSCHTEEGWKSTSGASGDFHKNMQLVGVHLLTDCKSCHSVGRMLRGTSQECSTCHIKEDNHNGQLPHCGECHLQNFWNQTKFDHNLTRFPLQGAHRVTDCRSCHNQGVYQGLPTDCRSCHFQDAARVTTPEHVSPRRFPCERCHSQFQFQGAVDQ